MALRFSTCYPALPQGTKTPCGIVMDTQDGRVQEIICPELSEAVCRQLAAAWNAQETAALSGKALEETLAVFITRALEQL